MMPTTGALSFDQLRTEWGKGQSNVGIASYYQGPSGSSVFIVRPPDVCTSVPTGGAFALNVFYGAARVTGGSGGAGLGASKSGDAYGYETGDVSEVTVYSNTVTITPSGGTAPYSYLWSFVSGVGSTMYMSTTGASMYWGTYFSNGTANDWSELSTYKCRVTDNVSNFFDVEVAVLLEAYIYG